MGSTMTDDRERSQAKKTVDARSAALPPLPDKPLTEMTRDELMKWRRDLSRWQRDRAVRSGRVAPRTMRETEIWLEAGRRTGSARGTRTAPIPEGDD
jgi:hypothetical protein